MVGTVRLHRADVLWRATASGILIRRRGDDETVELAGSGVALWHTLAEPSSRADLVEALARGHRVDAATVASDVGPVVDELVARGVLVER